MTILELERKAFSNLAMYCPENKAIHLHPYDYLRLCKCLGHLDKKKLYQGYEAFDGFFVFNTTIHCGVPMFLCTKQDHPNRKLFMSHELLEIRGLLCQ
jgi:hypothetical protein